MGNYTTYAKAVENLSLVLCNNIAEVDPSVYDNMRFNSYDEENDIYTEIFQWFLTDASESTVEYLEKRHDLLFSYSDLLDCFVLCVDHWGTSWSGVNCIDKMNPKTYEIEE